MDNNNLPVSYQKNVKFRRIIMYLFGILEVLLAFRFVFKLLGANPDSPFVIFIYNLSHLFLAPFIGIFKASIAQGIETTAYFEAATLIGMVVYALVAYGIVRIVEIMSQSRNRRQL